MTEFCEGVQPPAIEEESPREDKKTPVNVRCIMLFDGTMNNKTNIESRISRNEFYESTRSKKYKLFGERVGPGADSYENGVTNIVTLDKHIEDKPANGYDIVVKIYTEGAGTIDNKDDKLPGYAIGMGKAGVIKKCEKGIVTAIDKILDTNVGSTDTTIDPETQYIKKLTVDVFGFSRGAATARYCIYKALYDEKYQFKKMLANRGIDSAVVEVWFAGLFDTVSSHGIKFSDDTRALELDAVQHATKTLHLVAGEEYRKNFSITNIKSAASKGGEEYFMPGVHSDVGGSYHEFSDETFQLNYDWQANVDIDKATLIAENWYTEQEIDYQVIYNEALPFPEASITANRKGISNAYCNIPLKLMAKGAENQKIVILTDLKRDADDAIMKADKHFGTSDLSTLDSKIASYMTTTQTAFNALIQDPLLKRIRHAYLHMSAKHETGLKPRFKDDPVKGRQRWRMVYDG